MGDAVDFSTGLEKKGNEKSYSWQLDYSHPLSEHTSVDVSYFNQGHFEGHHRDGAGASLWASTTVLDPHLTVSAGAGPWAYADTVISGQGAQAKDVHGLGAMAGLGAAWHSENHLVYQLRANYFTAKNSFNTYSVMGSVGYDFGQSDSHPSESPSGQGKNEVSVLAGKDIVNIPGDVPSIATEVEYRRHLGNSVDVSVAAISEGNNSLAQRKGLAPELWLRKDLLDDHLSLSAGVGGYFGEDKKMKQDGKGTGAFTSGIASVSASYKLSDHWKARATWHRPITSNNRDADIIVAGIGYQF